MLFGIKEKHSTLHTPFYQISVCKGSKQYIVKLSYRLLNNYCHLQGFPRKIIVEHRLCFLSHNFKSIWEKFKIETIYCTVSDHRSIGLVERLVYTVKSKTLALSDKLPKLTLNSSIAKSIWNQRITKKPSIGCTFVQKTFQPHC